MKAFRLALLRHGKTNKHDQDARRQIIDDGIMQAAKAACALTSEKIHLGLVSPTDRTVATGRIAFATHPETPIRLFRAIYPDPDLPENSEIWKMFRELGNVPIKDYLPHPSYKLLEKLGDVCASNIEAIVEEIEAKSPFLYLVGHNVLNQAVAHGIARRYKDEAAAKEIEALNLSEGERFQLIVGESGITVVG